MTIAQPALYFPWLTHCETLPRGDTDSKAAACKQSAPRSRSRSPTSAGSRRNVACAALRSPQGLRCLSKEKKQRVGLNAPHLSRGSAQKRVLPRPAASKDKNSTSSAKSTKEEEAVGEPIKLHFFTSIFKLINWKRRSVIITCYWMHSESISHMYRQQHATLTVKTHLACLWTDRLSPDILVRR